MHASVYDWVATKVADHFLARLDTVELGSQDVNGSVRPLFTGRYVGVDMQPGPGVDVVALASRLPFADNEFGVVVCTEMLEHDPAPCRTVVEAHRVVAVGGHLLLTTRGIGFPLHGYPSDYWRFTKDGLLELVEHVGFHVVTLDTDPQPEHPGVFCFARKLRHPRRRR